MGVGGWDLWTNTYNTVGTSSSVSTSLGTALAASRARCWRLSCCCHAESRVSARRSCTPPAPDTDGRHTRARIPIVAEKPTLGSAVAAEVERADAIGAVAGGGRRATSAAECESAGARSVVELRQAADASRAPANAGEDGTRCVSAAHAREGCHRRDCQPHTPRMVRSPTLGTAHSAAAAQPQSRPARSTADGRKKGGSDDGIGWKG